MRNREGDLPSRDMQSSGVRRVVSSRLRMQHEAQTWLARAGRDPTSAYEREQGIQETSMTTADWLWRARRRATVAGLWGCSSIREPRRPIGQRRAPRACSLTDRRDCYTRADGRRNRRADRRANGCFRQRARLCPRGGAIVGRPLATCNVFLFRKRPDVCAKSR